METRANTTLVGAFTLLLIAAAFGFVYWFKGPERIGDRDRYSIVFSGSVSGLRVGAPVYFNGLRVGEVEKIEIAQDPRNVVTVVGLDAAKVKVNRNVTATLDVQILSGIASVGLRGGEPTQEAPIPGALGLPEIPAVSSGVADLMAGARDVMARADAILAKVDKVVSDNQSVISDTMKNVKTFSDALARNSDKIDPFMADLAQTNKSLQRVAEQIEQKLAGIDPKKIDNTLTNVEKFTKMLGDNTPKFDAFVGEATEISKKVNRIASQLEGILGSEDGKTKTLLSDLSETAKSIRVLANNLDKRTAEITAGITNFTGRGLKEYETLAVDARRAINEIDRVVRRFEKSPAGFVFGKDSVPEYSGRR